MKTLQEIHEYWKNPDEQNYPEKYLNGEERTAFLVDKISNRCDKSSCILEIGCNCGRNLNGLYQSGYKNLYGIEINENAINLINSYYPEVFENICIWGLPAERALISIPSNIYDLVFTMAVLEHIHPIVEKLVFENMKRVSAKYIMTIEDETTESDRLFPRNYQDVFECDEFKQIEHITKVKAKGFNNKYVYRLFERRA